MPNINIEVSTTIQTDLKSLAKACGMPFGLFIQKVYLEIIKENPDWIDKKKMDMENLKEELKESTDA